MVLFRREPHEAVGHEAALAAAAVRGQAVVTELADLGRHVVLLPPAGVDQENLFGEIESCTVHILYPHFMGVELQKWRKHFATELNAQ